MQIAELKRVEPSLGGSLRDALLGLGIVPFDINLVEKYKKSKAYKTMWSGQKKALFEGGPWLLLFVGCFIACWRAEVYLGSPHPSVLQIGGMIAGIAAQLLSGFGVVLTIDYITSHLNPNKLLGYRTIYSWKLVLLYDYPRPISDSAYQMVSNLAESKAGIKYEVDTLMENDEYAPDPFLVVSMGTEKYYIEVWDEKF